MRVELHDGLTNPKVLPATRIVIYDDQGTPVAFALQRVRLPDGREHLVVADAADKDFMLQLRSYGIDRTVIVQHQGPLS